jgi:hypothetical protein
MQFVKVKCVCAQSFSKVVSFNDASFNPEQQQLGGSRQFNARHVSRIRRLLIGAMSFVLQLLPRDVRTSSHGIVESDKHEKSEDCTSHRHGFQVSQQVWRSATLELC